MQCWAAAPSKEVRLFISVRHFIICCVLSHQVTALLLVNVNGAERRIDPGVQLKVLESIKRSENDSSHEKHTARSHFIGIL